MRPTALLLGTVSWVAGWHFVKSQVSQRTGWLLLGAALLFYFLLSAYLRAMERRLRNDYLTMTAEEREGFRQALVADDPKGGEVSFREIAEDRRTDWRWIARDQVVGFGLAFGLPLAVPLAAGHKLSIATPFAHSDLKWMLALMLVGGAVYWWLHVRALNRYQCRQCRTALTRDRSRAGVIFPCERCQCVWHLGDM